MDTTKETYSGGYLKKPDSIYDETHVEEVLEESPAISTKFYEKPEGWNRKKVNFFTLLWKGYLGKDLDAESQERYERISTYFSAAIMITVLALVTFILPRFELPKNEYIEKGKTWVIEKYNDILNNDTTQIRDTTH